MHIYIHKYNTYIYIYIFIYILIKFLIARFFLFLKSLPDFQALLQPCSTKNKTDSHSIELDNNNNKNNFNTR